MISHTTTTLPQYLYNKRRICFLMGWLNSPYVRVAFNHFLNERPEFIRKLSAPDLLELMDECYVPFLKANVAGQFKVASDSIDESVRGPAFYEKCKLNFLLILVKNHPEFVNLLKPKHLYQMGEEKIPPLVLALLKTPAGGDTFAILLKKKPELFCFITAEWFNAYLVIGNNNHKKNPGFFNKQAELCNLSFFLTSPIGQTLAIAILEIFPQILKDLRNDFLELRYESDSFFSMIIAGLAYVNLLKHIAIYPVILNKITSAMLDECYSTSTVSNFYKLSKPEKGIQFLSALYEANQALYAEMTLARLFLPKNQNLPLKNLNIEPMDAAFFQLVAQEEGRQFIIKIFQRKIKLVDELINIIKKEGLSAPMTFSLSFYLPKLVEETKSLELRGKLSQLLSLCELSDERVLESEEMPIENEQTTLALFRG